MAYTPTERLGIYATGFLVNEKFGWIFREQPIEDWGIDAQIEVVDGGKPTGRLIAAQIKSGESWFNEELEDGFVYRGVQRHLEYWRCHSLPVVLILYNPKSRIAYWQVVHDEDVECTGSGWKILVPKCRQLEKATAGELRKIALPDYSKRRKFDYLSSLLNGFATQSKGSFSRLPILYASLFAADQQICVLSPYIDLEMVNALAMASTSAKVQALVNKFTDSSINIGQLQVAFPNLDIRIPKSDSAQLHAKIIIIDSTLAIHGSANLTTWSWKNATELHFSTTDPELVNNAQHQFDQLSTVLSLSTWL
jgi:hypothetical protein